MEIELKVPFAQWARGTDGSPVIDLRRQNIGFSATQEIENGLVSLARMQNGGTGGNRLLGKVHFPESPEIHPHHAAINVG